MIIILTDTGTLEAPYRYSFWLNAAQSSGLDHHKSLNMGKYLPYMNLYPLATTTTSGPSGQAAEVLVQPISKGELGLKTGVILRQSWDF
jgi:hypothetical protein